MVIGPEYRGIGRYAVTAMDSCNSGFSILLLLLYTVPQKRLSFYFSNNSQKLAMIFGGLNPEKMTPIACTFAHLSCIL